MGTGAFMTLINQTGYDLSCSVSNIVCMYENGKGGSHLERFNTHLEKDQSVNHIYIEAKAAVFSECAIKQSCFTLNFFCKCFGDGNIGFLTINLGSHAYNTSVVHNTNKALIKVEIYSGKQHTINIEIVSTPLPVSLLNSFVWSNREAIEKCLKLPAEENSQFKVSAAALTGLTTLVCTEATVAGSFENGTLLNGTLEADEFFNYCELTIKELHLTVGTGILIRNPKLLLNGKMVGTKEGIQIIATKISLKSGELSIPGAGVIPDVILTALFQWLESIMDKREVQELILALINEKIPKIPVGT